MPACCAGREGGSGCLPEAAGKPGTPPHCNCSEAHLGHGRHDAPVPRTAGGRRGGGHRSCTLADPSEDGQGLIRTGWARRGALRGRGPQTGGFPAPRTANARGLPGLCAGGDRTRGTGRVRDGPQGESSTFPHQKGNWEPHRRSGSQACGQSRAGGAGVQDKTREAGPPHPRTKRGAGEGPAPEQGLWSSRT